MTASPLGRVITHVLAYRGWTSPEKLASSYPPRTPPLSGATIRRIMDDEDANLHGDEGELKLVRLAGMLNLPIQSLIRVRDLDAEAVRRLDFREDDQHLRQFIADSIEHVRNPPRRRATDRKRA